MKNWLKRNIGSICSSCLALTFVYHIGTFSLCMFGEPELPTED